MEQDNVLDKIDDLIETNNYKKLYTYLITYFSTIKENEIINIVKYKELLLNKNSDINKKTKLIEPLKKYLKEKKISIEDYLQCCEVVNLEFNILNKRKREELKKMYNYNINVVLTNILSKIENYNHRIMEKSNRLTLNTANSLIEGRNLIQEYEYGIEGLSILLKDIFFNRKRFEKHSFKNDDMFRKNIERCMKKTLRINKLHNCVTSIVHLNNMVEQIQNYDLKFINENLDNYIYFEFKNVEEYKKKAIASKRCSIHDLNHQIEYKSNLKLDKDFEDKLQKNINWNNLIEDDDKRLKVRFEIFSDEILSIMLESYKEFDYQTKEMLSNSFIGEEINNKIIGENFKYNITYKEAINFYYILQVLSFTYFKATEVYTKRFKKEPIMSFLAIDINGLMKIIEPIYKSILDVTISEEKLRELLRFYSFSENDIFDLYYKPIIKLEENLIVIMPSVIKNNNFNRTFIEHMNLIKANFKQGIAYEEYLKELFKKSGFIVYDKESPKLNFDIGNNKKGDIDLLMKKGKYIFYSQIKNRANPIESRDYIAFDRKINKKAIKQLNYAKEFLKSNPKYITDFFEIDDLKDFELVPFIITNSFYASGDKRKGIYITDTSSLNVFLEKGEINIKNFQGKVVYTKKIKNGPVEEGLINHLKNPYFKDEKLYYDLYIPRAYFINDKIYVFKVQDEIIETHRKSCYINKILNSGK